MNVAVPPDETTMRRLSAGLRRMQAQPLHGHGCSCCGGGLVALSASTIEADLLGLLALRYRAAGEAALLQLVERRLAARDSSLLDWISGQVSTSPAGGLRETLRNDLVRAVEQAAPPQGATRPRFDAR